MTKLTVGDLIKVGDLMKLECPHCIKLFPTWAALKFHIDRAHQKAKDSGGQ